MHIKDTIDTGNGWILPEGKCLELNLTHNNIRGLHKHDPNIESLFLARDYNDPHSIGDLLEYLYSSKYVRVGRCRDIVLFEHGAMSRPSKEDMFRITSKIKYKGVPVTCRSSLYSLDNREDRFRKRFFNDKY